MVTEERSSRSIVGVLFSITRVMNIVAIVTLVLMMLLTVSDVFLRTVFKQPILDSPQLTQYLMVCVVFFGLAWCAMRGRHIKVDLVVSHFPPRVQAIFDSVTFFLGLGACIIMTWRSFLESLVAYEYKSATTVLEVPAFPFHLLLTFGLGILCLVMLMQLVQHLYRAVKG